METMRKRGVVELSVLITISFIVVLIILLSVFSSAILSKETYLIGEKVKLNLEGVENYELKIITPSTSYKMEGSNEVFVFRPEEIGVYKVNLQYGDKRKSYEFEVVDGFYLEEDIEVIEEEKNETIKDKIIEEEFVKDNETLENVKEDFEEKRDEIEETEGRIVINQPVRWNLKENIEGGIGKVKIKIPVQAENVSVYKYVDGDKEIVDVEIDKNLFRNTFTRVVSLNRNLGNTYVKLDDVQGEVEVEYYTGAAEKEEKQISERKKEVVVRSPHGLHYENVTAFTSLSIGVSEKDLIRVYWKEESKYLDFEAFDLDADGLLDYVEWVVPHLSSQSFEIIIEIRKAEHLDVNKNVIEDVYEEVRARDDLFKEIPENHYVRVTFEQELTDKNDITIYAKSENGASVEVYEKDSDVKIADFGLIQEYGKYQVFLSGLIGSQDMFDLKVVGQNGSVEFDYIVDPVQQLAVIDRVYTGFTQLASATSTDVSIGASVNLSSSILFFTGTLDSAEPDDQFVYANLTNSTNIHFEREEGTGTYDLFWYVAEFSSGVNVQRGTFDYTTTAQNLQTAVNISQAFLLSSYENTPQTNTWGTDDSMYSNMVNDTAFGVFKQASRAGTVAWQVIEYGGAIVQNGTFSLSGATTDVTINEINTNKSFVYATWSTSGNVGADDFGVLLNFTNGTVVHVERVGTGSTLTGRWFVVEFVGNENVYSNQANFGTSDTQLNLSIGGTINVSRSVALLSGRGWGGSGSQTVDNAGDVWFTANITNSTNLRLTRANSGTTATARWFVIEFPGADSGLTVNITFPQNTSYSENVTILNYTVSGGNLDSCWYTLDSGITNTTVTCGDNVTGLNAGDGGHTWSVYVNDTNNVVASDSVTFSVDTSLPGITVNAPVNGSTIADVTPTLNVSLNKLLDKVWYTLNDGVTNTTLCEDCSGEQYSYLHLPEGTHTVIVYANDSSNELGSNSTAFTIEMDFHYFDSFDDNSSLNVINNVTWNVGNITFIAKGSTEISTEEAENLSLSGGYVATTNCVCSSPSQGYCVRHEGTVGDEGYANVTSFGNRTGEYNVTVKWCDESDDSGAQDNYTVYVNGQARHSWLSSDGAGPGEIWQTEAVVLTINNGDSVTVGAVAGSSSTYVRVDWINISGTGNGGDKGNFTVYSVNTTETITKINNITWNEDNTDTDNNISVQVSANNGGSWTSVTKGQDTDSITEGSALLYRIFFTTNESRNISLLDFNITWSNSTVLPPQITVNAPVNGSTIADVTPTLNVTLDKTVSTLWYTTDSGVINKTICVDCGGGQTAFLHLPEGNYTAIVYANDSANRIGTNSTTFTIDMNFGYFDSFDDNSSLDANEVNNIVWGVGNVSFTGSAQREQIEFIGCEDDATEVSKWQDDNSGAAGTLDCETAAELTDASPRTGSYALTLTGNFDPSVDEWNRTVDLSGYRDVNITLWTSTEDTEAADNFTLYYWNNTAWVFLAEDTRRDAASQTSWLRQDVSIPDYAATSSFQIRATWETSSTAEHMMMDDINFTGIPTTIGNFTSYSINTTENIKQITNITWNEDNTDAINNISVEITVDNGQNWYLINKSEGFSGFTENNTLIYRVFFATNESRTISLLDLTINWSNVGLPLISILYPGNTSYTNNVTELNYTVSGGNLDSCWYTLDEGITNTTVTCGNNVTGLNAGDGGHTWSVYVNNTNNFIASDSITFSVDTQAPNVTLNSPANETTFTTSSVTFNWTVIDNIDALMLCNLTIDGTVEAANLNSTNGTSTAHILNGVSAGSHDWNVTCFDDFGNAGTSETREFTINIQTTFSQVIKGVGTTSGDTTDVIISPALTNTTKAFHFVTYRHTAENDHADTFLSSEIVNETLLRIYGDNTGGNNAIDFEYKIVEFTTNSPLTVQRINMSIQSGETATVLNFTIPDRVNLSESFLSFDGHSHHSTDTTIGSEELERIRLVNETAIQYGVGAQDGGAREVRAEIIDWNDNNFIKLAQRDITTLAAGSTSITITPSTTVNPNKTLLFVNAMEGGSSAFTEPPSEIGLYASIATNGDIAIQREASGPELLMAWQLVEFQAGAVNVQHIQANFSGGTASGNFSLVQAVNTNRSVAFGTVTIPFGHSGARASDTTGGAIDRNMFTVSISNSTDVQAIRGDSTGTASLGIQVIEFTGLPTISNVNATDITSTTARIIWDTDVISNSSVEYGTNLNLTSSEDDNSLVISHSVTLSGLTASTLYFYNVTSCNTSGCDSEGVFNFTTSATPEQAPVVFLTNPANNTIQNISTISLFYNTTDANSNIANSTLILNGERNQTNTSVVLEDQISNITVTLLDGVYTWTVNVTDTTNLEGTNTSVRSFTIDTQAPSVSLHNPLANESFDLSNILFNLTVTDNIDSVLVCDLIVDSSVLEDDFNANSGVSVNITKTLTAGDHLWNVTCIDDASNTGVSETRNFTITDEPPIVLLITANNSFSTTGNVTLEYNATDNNGFSETRLLLNDVVNLTNQTEVLNNEINNFTLTNYPEGVYTWDINVTDNGGFSVVNGSARVFTVDLNDPNVTLNAPANNTISNSSTVDFNFTVVDTIDTSLSCTLYVGSVSDGSFSATNGSLTNRQLTGLTDGGKLWNVSCSDDSGRQGVSETWFVNITEYPKIQLNTTNNSFYNTSAFELFYTPSDNTNLSACGLYIDSSFNQTNSSAVINGAENNFSVSGILEGTHTWYVSCNDTINLQNQSEIRTFTVDLDGLTVNLDYPTNDLELFTSLVNFTFNASDNIDPSLLCNITVNSVVVNVSHVTSGELTVRNVSFAQGGFKVWNVTCSDDSLNTITSETRNFTLAFAPVVRLINPGNNTFQNVSTISLFYEVEDDNNNIANATLILNNQRNQTNQSAIINEAENNFTVTLNDGTYTWTVNVTDTTNLEGTNTSVRSFTIDTQAPNVTLKAPGNNSLVTWNNITFNFTATDAFDANISCDLYINHALESQNINVTNATDSIQYVVKADGNYNWSVSCVDNANNTANSVLFNFSIEAPPNVTLASPENGNVSNISTIQFRYIPEDALGFTNCSLFVDNTINDSIDEPDNGIENTFTVNGIQDGHHNWTVECIDASPDFNSFSPNVRNFTVDTVNPTIIQNEPLNNTNTLKTVEFNFTASDNLDLNLSCDLYIDGILNVSSLNVTNGTNSIQSISGFSLGLHDWNVTCVDNALNRQWSETLDFNVTLADLMVNTTSIVFNTSSPNENETVRINATVYNLINVTVKNVVVQFYDGDPDSTGVQIGANQTISSVSGLSQEIAGVNWNADIGTSAIFVIVDPPLASNGTIEEWNENNNEANSSIAIGGWHFIYGDITSLSEFELETEKNRSVIRWESVNFESGNLYVADSESVITWTSLQAIGRNDTGGITGNDFTDIDTLLNMTGFSDSVSEIYTNDSGSVFNTTSYTVFNSVIANVPIVNSTNNTNFYTGILWDTSDDSNLEFDTVDVEDLVFISTVETDRIGAYGTYDYEMRIPAQLREYKDLESRKVVFYTELR